MDQRSLGGRFSDMDDGERTPEGRYGNWSEDESASIIAERIRRQERQDRICQQTGKALA